MLLFTGGLVGLSVEILGLIADVKVIIDLAEGQGVRRSWSIVGAAIWGLNFVAAIAGTIGWSLSSQPIGRNLAIAWLALSAASLALNIAGAAKPPTVLPTLIPVAGGVPTPGLMLVGRC